MTNTTHEELPPLPEQDCCTHVTDSETMDLFRADQMRDYASQCIAALKAENARAAAESREKVGILRDVLYRNGFVECDIAACNCGSWHARYGLKERFDEICAALQEADVLNNETDNLPLRAIAKLVERAEAAQSQVAAMAGLLEETQKFISRNTSDGMLSAADELQSRIDAALASWKGNTK